MVRAKRVLTGLGACAVFTLGGLALVPTSAHAGGVLGQTDVAVVPGGGLSASVTPDAYGRGLLPNLIGDLRIATGPYPPSSPGGGS